MIYLGKDPVGISDMIYDPMSYEIYIADYLHDPPTVPEGDGVVDTLNRWIVAV